MSPEHIRKMHSNKKPDDDDVVQEELEDDDVVQEELENPNQPYISENRYMHTYITGFILDLEFDLRTPVAARKKCCGVIGNQIVRVIKFPNSADKGLTRVRCVLTLGNQWKSR
jgi:hypothetical protein